MFDRRKIAVACFAVALAAEGCSRGTSHRVTGSSAPSAVGGVVALNLAQGVFLNGARIADVPTDSNSIQPLAAELRAKRTAWRTDHPNDEFPGDVLVELPEGASGIAALRILNTCAKEGFPNVDLRLGDASYPVRMTWPEFAYERIGTHLWYRADGTVEVRIVECWPPYDVVPAAEIATPLRDLEAEPFTPPWIGCDPSVRFDDMLKSLNQTFRANPSATLRFGAYAPCTPPQGLSPVPEASKHWRMTVEIQKNESKLGEPAIKQAFARVEDRLAGCYAAAKKVDRDLGSRVLARFMIGTKGQAGSVSMLVLGTDQLERCLEAEGFTLRVDPPPRAVVNFEVWLEFAAK